MGLLIWLPLDKNLSNQGLRGDIIFSSYSSTTGLGTNNIGNLGGKAYERTASAANAYRSSQSLKLSGDVTMCCWAYVTNTPAGDTANGLITNHNHVDGSGFGITVKQISTSDYRISCSEGRSGSDRTYHTLYGTTNIKNAWHHLALTYKRSTGELKLYVDGICEKVVTGRSSAIGTNPFDIFCWSTGHISSSDYRAWGRLNDVRLYDECLSQKKIRLIAQGLFAHYSFRDEYCNQLSVICDQSGYKHDLNVYGNKLIAQEDTPRNYYSNYFDGSTYLRSKEKIVIPTKYTISTWVKRKNGGHIFDWRDVSNGKGLQPIYINPTDSKLQFYNSVNDTGGYFNYAFQTNTWYHICITGDSSNAKLYINGNYHSTVSNALNNEPAEISIAARLNNANITNVNLSDFRIYSSILKDAEIKKLYNSPIEIDDKYNLHGYEFIELEESEFKKSGIVGFRNYSNLLVQEAGGPFGDLLYSLDDGGLFARIHWLDVSSDKTFFTTAEASHCTGKSNRFSRLDVVDHFKMDSVLPKGYTRLDYIQSTGTQYINTNYYWKHEAVKIEMDAIVTSNSANQSLFGNEEPYSGGRYFSIVPHGINGSYSYYVGSNAPLISGVSTCTINQRFTLECETTNTKLFTVKVNGTVKTSKTYSGTVTGYANTTSSNANRGKIYIFANHNSSNNPPDAGIQMVGGMKLYGFKMYDNGKMVRNFIPCKNSNNAVGLFDTIENKFYANAGSGNFTAGNVVSDGYYEFILRYPRLSATAYNRWKQTGSPWESAPGGYERIETSWTAHAGPLRKASGDAQFNCDNVGSTTWYAAIGQTNGWTNSSIPGADGNQQFETELWIRIDDGKGHLFYDGTKTKLYEDYILTNDYIEF